MSAKRFMVVAVPSVEDAQVSVVAGGDSPLSGKEAKRSASLHLKAGMGKVSKCLIVEVVEEVNP